jgi:hypothetical protein
VATSLNNLANVYRDTGRFAEAEPLYQRALWIRERALPAGDAKIVQVVENYARLLQLTDRGMQANDLVARVRPQRREEVLPAVYRP